MNNSNQQQFLQGNHQEPQSDLNSQGNNNQLQDEELKESDIKKNLNGIYENRDQMNSKYIELLEKEQQLRMQLWKQQIDQIKTAQNSHLTDNKYNKNMGMIAHLTNNTLPAVNSPFNQYFANQNVSQGPGGIAATGQFGTPNQIQQPNFHSNNNTQNQSMNQQFNRTPENKDKYIKEIQEKEMELMRIKDEMSQTKLQYEEIFQKHNRDQQERFQKQLQLAEQENQKLKRFYEAEIEKKNRELQSGEKLYQELAERHKVAIEQKDREMNEFIQYKYKPLEEKVEVLREENIISENKVNVNKQSEEQKQQDEIKKMQIFIMSQKQELDNLRKTAQEYDHMRRTNQIPVNFLNSRSEHQSPAFQENQTQLLAKIDNLNQLLEIERQKNRNLRENQENINNVNQQLFPEAQDSQTIQEYKELVQQLRRENESLQMLTLAGEIKPIVVKKKQQMSKNQRLLTPGNQSHFLQDKKNQIDTDKLLKSKDGKPFQEGEIEENFDGIDDDVDNSNLSIHTASIQPTPFQKQSQYDSGPGSQMKEGPNFIQLGSDEEIDEQDCIKKMNTLRQYMKDLVQKNELLKQGIQGQVDGNLGGNNLGNNNEVNKVLQEKLEQMKVKYEQLLRENRELKQTIEQQFEQEGLLNPSRVNNSNISLNDSMTNVNARNLKVQNQKLKAYLQMKVNEAEEHKVKSMRCDQLVMENEILQKEVLKLRGQQQGGLSKSGQGQNYDAFMQVRDIEMRYQIQQQELFKVTNALREKMQENEKLRADSISIQKHAKENIFNMERSFKDNYQNMEKSFRENQNKAVIINQELEKVTSVLRGKLKESDELKAAIGQFDKLMKEKNAQNDQLTRKCQQLAGALQQKVNDEQRVQEALRQNQQLRADMDKITNALREKLRENENIKANFRKLEQYLRERELIEGELRKMKEVIDQKVKETGEWRNRCQQMEGRMRQTQELEGKMRDLQGKMRFVLQEITSIPNKVGISQSGFY